MTASAKQVRDLIERTPPRLRAPFPGYKDLGVKGALSMWAAERGFNPPEAVHLTIRTPEDDEIFGSAYVGNVAVMALLHLLQVETELARTNAIRGRTSRVESPPKTSQALSKLEYLAHMRGVERNTSDTSAPGIRLDLSRLTKQALEKLAEHQTGLRLELEQLREYLQLFEAYKQRPTVPFVASVYMAQPQRAQQISEKTIALNFITSAGMPLLRAIAMIGDLRNGGVPVDVEHPDLDKIYERHIKNLQGFRTFQRKAMERFESKHRNLSIDGKRQKRHKRQHERHAAKTKEAR